MVNANWIMQLVQSKKLSIEKGRDLVGECGVGAIRCIHELEMMEAEEERRAYRHAQTKAATYLATKQKAFKQYSIVDAWLEQYKVMSERTSSLS